MHGVKNPFCCLLSNERGFASAVKSGSNCDWFSPEKLTVHVSQKAQQRHFPMKTWNIFPRNLWVEVQMHQRRRKQKRENRDVPEWNIIALETFSLPLQTSTFLPHQQTPKTRSERGINWINYQALCYPTWFLLKWFCEFFKNETKGKQLHVKILIIIKPRDVFFGQTMVRCFHSTGKSQNMLEFKFTVRWKAAFKHRQSQTAPGLTPHPGNHWNNVLINFQSSVKYTAWKLNSAVPFGEPRTFISCKLFNAIVCNFVTSTKSSISSWKMLKFQNRVHFISRTENVTSKKLYDKF